MIVLSDVNCLEQVLAALPSAGCTALSIQIVDEVSVFCREAQVARVLGILGNTESIAALMEQARSNPDLGLNIPSFP
jgi:hypothetical protein